MRELGYTEGRDYTIEHRSAQSDLARLPALAAELLALRVDVIVSSGTPSAFAAHKAAPQISILTTSTSDPVGSGLAV
jgi:putative ABC transport system substrate-binding protein